MYLHDPELINRWRTLLLFMLQGLHQTATVLQDLLYEEELLRNPFSLKMWSVLPSLKCRDTPLFAFQLFQPDILPRPLSFSLAFPFSLAFLPHLPFFLIRIPFSQLWVCSLGGDIWRHGEEQPQAKGTFCMREPSKPYQEATRQARAHPLCSMFDFYKRSVFKYGPIV